MKRILFIILAVVAVFVVVGLSFAGHVSPETARTRSLDAYDVPC